MGGEKKPNRFESHVPAKAPMTEINQYLMCQLCSGYLVDATAIIECQHTFCKSCILKYLDTNSYCPICDVQLNKAKPHLSLRADTTLQKLVYKMVPGLLVTEVRRRKEYQVKVPSSEATAAATPSTPVADSVEPEEAEDVCVLSMDDAVSLSLEYYKGSGGTGEDALASVKKCSSGDKANDRRYLQCPAAVSVGLLKKFIRMKYGLSDDYRVDLLYNGDRDKDLENDLTLLDLAVMFKWKKTEPMCFYYRIFDRPVKSELVRVGSKRTASSMMDEPPDDDGASGTANNSMASPSKLSRLSEGNQGGSTSGSGSGNSGSGGGKKSHHTSQVVPMETSTSTSSSNNNKKTEGKTRSRSQSIASDSKDKEDVEDREPSPPQTRSSLTLKLSKRLTKGLRSRSNSSTSNVNIPSHRLLSPEGSVREAVEKIVLSKKVAERKTSDPLISPSSCSSGSDMRDSPPSLKISLKNATMYHHHHHKHKHKSKDRERHKRHKSSSSSPKHHHHRRAKRGSKESSEEEVDDKEKSEDDKVSNNSSTSKSSSQTVVSSNKNADEAKSPAPIQRKSSTEKAPEKSSNHHPLVPESVQMQVPKSVTLIPVNPNAPTVKRSSTLEKNPPVNRNTFTHPITNKSLHQITVTEVPPPPKSTGPSTPTTSAVTTSTSATNSSSNKSSFESGGGSSGIPAPKPHFSAPDSMEITKIYCDNSGKQFDPSKKLKERKGLDITISPSPGPQINNNNNNNTNSNNKGRKLSDDSLTFSTKFTPKGIKPLNSQAPKGFNNLKTTQLPFRANVQAGASGKPEPVKNKRPSISIEPALTPGLMDKNNMSSSHRKAISNLDSSIAIYEVGSLHRTPSPPKEKGLVVTPIPNNNNNNKEAMMPPKNIKRFEPPKQQKPPQVRQESKTTTVAAAVEKKREKEHDSPLDLSGKSSRSPTDNKSERFPSPKPPTPVASPTASPSPDRQKAKQQSSATQTQTILSIAQSLAQKQQMQLQQQQREKQLQKEKLHREKQQQQHQQHREKQQQQQQREKQHQQQHQREKQLHQQQQQQKQRSSPLPPSPPKSQSHSPSSSAVAAAAAAAAAIGSLTHPLSSPMIPMSQPSPPGSFHPLRNLVTLSEAASLMKLKNHEQQSLNSINQLVAAAAVGSSMSPPATQMLPSPRSSLLPPSMTMRPSHLPATLGSPSSGTLSLPPKSNMLHDGLGGMPWAASMNLQRGLLQQQGLGAGSLSPPMPNPLANPYLSGLSHPPVSAASQAMRPSPTMRIPSSSKKDTLPSKNNSAPVSSATQWPPMGIYNNSKPSLPDNNKSLLANPHTSASHILRSSSLSSSASVGSSRQSKMNGTLGSSQDHSLATFVAPSSIKPVSKTPVSSKNAIPNSMKISNFLPPPQSKSNGSSNAPATITSSSSLAKYFSSMPPLLPPQSPPSGSGGSDGKIKTSSCPPQPSPLSSLSSLPSSFAFPLSSSHLPSAAPPSLTNFKFNRSSSPPGSSARTMPVSVATAAAAATTAETFALSINCDTGRSKECSKSPTKSGRASQPPNQAVRHIPNPSLLFNRQANNSSCQTQNNASNNLPKNKETKEDSVNMPESTKKSVSDEAKTAPVATATAKGVALTTATAKDVAVTTVSAKEAKATVTAEDVAATALAKGVTVNAKEAAVKAEEAPVKAEETAVKAEEEAIRLPIEEVIPPIQEVTTPVEETKAPIKEVTMSTEEVTTPIEEAAAPTEVIAAPIEGETVAIKQIVTCTERIQPPPQTAVIAKSEEQKEELAPTVERPQANDTETSTQQIETAESVEIPVTEEHDKKPAVPAVEPEVKPAVESEQIEERVEEGDLVDAKALKVETEVTETVESMEGVELPEPEKVAEESTQEPEKATCEEMNLMENTIEASAEVQKPEMATCEKMDLQENTVEATVDVQEPEMATCEKMDLQENTVEATVDVPEPAKATYEEMVEEKMTEVQESERDANATSTSATLEAEEENTKGTEVQEPETATAVMTEDQEPETATAVTTEDQEPEKIPFETPEETAVHNELVECEKPSEEPEAEMPEKVTETVEALNTTESVQDSLAIIEPAVLTTDANAQLPTIPQETVDKNADENIEKEALTEMNEEPTTPAPVEEPAKEPEAVEKEPMTSVEKVAEDSQIAAPSESVHDGTVNCEPMEIFASEPSVEPGRDSIEAPEGTQTSDFDTATDEITAEESIGTIIQDKPAEEMESEIPPEETATQGTEDLTVQKDSTVECENVEDTPVSPKNVEEVSGDMLIEEEAEVMEVENAEIIQAEDTTSEEENMAVEDESQEAVEAAENPTDEITIADTTTVIEMEKIVDLPQAQQSITELDNEISGTDIHCPSPNEPQIIATLTTPLIDSPPEEQSNQVECPHDDSVNVNEEVAIEDKLKGIKDTAAVDSDEVKDFDENSDELIIDTKRSVENDEIETATEPAESSVENYGEDKKKQIELSIQSDSQEDETTEEEDDVATTEESQEAIAGEESFTVPVQEEQISHPVEEEEEAMELDHVSASLESSSSAPQNGEETAEAALAIEAVEAIQIKVDPEINSLHNADATTTSDENNEDESSQVDTVPCIIKREVIEEHMEMDAFTESEPEHTPEVPMDIENTPDINEGQFEQPVEDGELDEMNTACETEEDETGNSSSSRPDSPIKVDLKKMENLEKVAAGLLATAANSINNNNNNSFTSGVGVPCDLGVGTATTTV